ncbi:uncharacterized protein LOC106168192 [Lingula anatina]|uniref:Uncharacterized protein LOC106168192 n=1 Tax=Lingula anatina TaxID=7574 RepID=A0A1S3IWP6_LINAN|nr:uncharacterized protein LOC106168192 [Lingula anatina]|eukprot:XP_013402612.1 uncharacterized protein LOC106168192 [Lingula anatina]
MPLSSRVTVSLPVPRQASSYDPVGLNRGSDGQAVKKYWQRLKKNRNIKTKKDFKQQDLRRASSPPFATDRNKETECAVAERLLTNPLSSPSGLFSNTAERELRQKRGSFDVYPEFRSELATQNRSSNN